MGDVPDGYMGRGNVTDYELRRNCAGSLLIMSSRSTQVPPHSSTYSQ